MKKIAIILAAIMLQSSVSCLASDNTASAREDKVDVYINTFNENQTITGVGGAITWYNNWLSNAQNRDEVYDILFKDAGLDVIRLKNFYGYKDIDFADTAAADRENIEKAQKAAGKEIPVLMSSWSPSAAYKSNGVEAGGGTIKKNDDGSYMYKETGEYFAEAVKAYRDAGVKIDYLSIQNEPDFRADYDGCELAAAESDEYAQYSKVFDATYEALQKLDNPPLMLGPDSMTASYTAINGMVRPSMEHNDGRVAVIGHHLYAGGSEENPDMFIKSMNNLRDNFPDIPKWQTEFYRGDLVQTAWLISNTFVEEDAEAYIYWDTVWGAPGGLVAIEDPWHKETWQTKKGYIVSDRLYGLAHFSKFTDGGYVRVDSSVDYQNNDIKAAAFNSPDKDKLVIVLTNTQDKNSAVKLNLNGYKANSSEIYLSSGQEGSGDKMAKKGALGDDMTADLPAYSVMTVVIDGERGEKPDKILEGIPAPEVESVKAQAVYGTPVIDGKADDIWEKTVSNKISIPAHGDHGASGEFKAMWDENNLYILADVTDENLDDSAQADHEQDSVEMFINELHTKLDGYEAGDAQYRVNYKNKQSFGNGQPDRENFKTEVSITDKGYIVEAALPLKQINGKNGTVIGFDIQINDSHASGARDYILKWSDPSDNTWSTLTEIGDVEFVGASVSENDEITVSLNGNKLEFPDQKPVIENDSVMLPIRAVAEALNKNVEWDNGSYAVHIFDGVFDKESVSEVKGDKKTVAVTVNGKEVIFSNQKPVIINERTMIAIRDVAEMLGKSVDWNETAYEVVITDK